MKKPNFFIIGAPKCGTTALSEYLREHPNIFLSSPKEPQYFAFDYDIATRTIPRLDLYLSLFSEADPVLHKAVGEASVNYLFSRVAVTEILQFNSEAKFIVMLRNPVDLICASHSNLVLDGKEDILDFEQAWRAEQNNINGRRNNRSCWRLYSERGMLGRQMERLFSVVPKERVKVIIFDDFVKNTLSVYEEVLRFLGVPSDGRRTFPKINPNKSVKWPWFQQNINILNNVWLVLRPRLGLTKGTGIRTWLRSLNSKSEERQPISNHLRYELSEFFYEDIKKLSRLIDRDLSQWICK
jgi:hypothetical protein